MNPLDVWFDYTNLSTICKLFKRFALYDYL